MWDRPDVLNRLADLLITLAVLGAFYGVLHFVLRLPVFPLREVRVTNPVALVSREQVKTVIRREIKGNFFTLDLAAARSAFAKLPWVRNVSMRRRWPDRLEVTLEEHVPLARWGDAALVNDHGEVFNAAYDGNLPQFVGPPESAKEIAIQYEFFRRSLAAIGKVPQQVQVTPRRAWQVRLEGGPTLELGREQIEARLARFVATYSRTLERLDRRIDLVDLRYANGFAVRIPEMGHEKTARKGRKRG
ncbi:MAG TPA: cell division protein FtsQ/DivIB [Burkholderiales bacterium]|jgi:cell division protein FtsQ|nr:cell division protein FtsQ/DivIB [Burkholderiales bacterium]